MDLRDILECLLVDSMRCAHNQSGRTTLDTTLVIANTKALFHFELYQCTSRLSGDAGYIRPDRFLEPFKVSSP